jgi:hypothetical protein
MYQNIANLFGALGYVSLLVQWFWMTVVLAGPLLSQQVFLSLLLPEASTTAAEVPDVTVPEPIGVIFLVLAVIFSLSISIYALFAVPRAVARGGKTLTTKTAKVALPHIARHKHLNKKQKKTLLERITWSVKLGLASIPLLALMIPVSTRLGLDQEVVAGFGLLCGAATLGWFALQFTTGRIGKVPAEKLW